MSRPTVSTLDGADELEVRRAVTTALVDSVWRVSSWHDADRLAADLLDRLRANGYEVLKVAWS
jgi:hypothetical protein